MTPRLAALLLALILPLAARADDGGWKRIPCVQSDALDVTLLLRRSATPAVPRFVGWELRNKTGRPMIVDNALYRLAEVEVFPVGGGRQWRRTGIIQSNPHDLLLREGPPPEVGHRPWTLPPGVTRRLAYASAYGHYSLSDLLPAGAGLVGRAHFGLTTRDADFNATGRYATPPKGVTFVFEYLPPDAAGVASMRRELAVLLAASPEGVDDVVYAHDLRRLLGRPEVADAATVDVLLDAIESERADHASRGVIVGHLNAHHADDPATIARYARGVADRGTSDWLRDLAGPASDVTHADLISPLVARAEEPRHPSEVGLTLGVLARHRPLADDPAALARTVGAGRALGRAAGVPRRDAVGQAGGRSPGPRRRPGDGRGVGAVPQRRGRAVLAPESGGNRPGEQHAADPCQGRGGERGAGPARRRPHAAGERLRLGRGRAGRAGPAGRGRGRASGPPAAREMRYNSSRERTPAQPRRLPLRPDARQRDGPTAATRTSARPTWTTLPPRG